jgi:hypothetical protein
MSTPITPIEHCQKGSQTFLCRDVAQRTKFQTELQYSRWLQTYANYTIFNELTFLKSLQILNKNSSIFSALLKEYLMCSLKAVSSTQGRVGLRLGFSENFRFRLGLGFKISG